MRLLAMSTSVTPITHQLGTVGNESIINSEDVRTPLGVRKVPKLSGNAIRHRMIRAPGAAYLVEALELKGQLNRDTMNLLFHGGLKREKAQLASLSRIADMQRLFPLFDLLGCCLPEDIVEGKLSALQAMLVCAENMTRIKSVVPDDWKTGDGISNASSFVSRWQYVRGKLTKSAINEALPELDKKGKPVDTDDSKMMPFAGTCVMPGAVWLHGFSIVGCTQLHYGCLIHCLRHWQSEGSTIGGQSSRGHGVLDLQLQSCEWDQDESAALYETHVGDNAKECREFLLACYEAPAKTSKVEKVKA